MNYEQNGFPTNNNMNRQRDLVLAANEYCLLQNKSNGSIKTHVGPLVVTISQQEALVNFNSRTKKFEETNDFEKAKQLFVSAPEGWYVILKNPTTDNQYPEAGKANASPNTIKIGIKVNIPGPASFALYPGQMAKVIRGHKLRTNQYLLARVYDAEAATKSTATMIDAEGNAVEAQKESYFTGQLLVIKGTEISFYIPPTGIEVLACDDHANEYVRDAVTLERLEYCILKDESGDKRYVHGPSVVFPKPTETFVATNNKGSGVIFRALELSPISGIYIKVIAEYEDKDKSGKTVKHPIGEELFITGNDQMIYYPRPEHAMIQYDGKYMHHAIAIPEGEGRYILNRLTGEVKTIKGPAMYLPDPRTEVVVKRKLSSTECNLYYPGNKEVLEYNLGLSEAATEKAARQGKTNITDAINNAYSTADQASTLAIFSANANISRGVSYTKPRTITLDTKYEGVVGINVWTGYAVNVVSKSGNREIVVGPATRLLDYDETLEAVTLSTGKPKSTDRVIKTAYLRIDNNKVSDIISVQTRDYVDVMLRVSYCVDFLPEYKDKWFSVDNYIKYLCDRQRSLLKREAKKYDIEEFYAKTADIVRKVVLDLDKDTGAEGTTAPKGRLFKENGMFVTDVEVLGVEVEPDVAKILEKHQSEMIQKALELSSATKRMKTVEKLAEYEKKESDLKHTNKMYATELALKEQTATLNKEFALNERRRAEEEASAQAKKDMQKILTEIHEQQIARDRRADDEKIATEKALAEIEEAKQKAYAEQVVKIMASIQPGLIEAMKAQANADLTSGIGNAIAPYAICGEESISTAVTRLLKGTTLEETLKQLGTFKAE